MSGQRKQRNEELVPTGKMRQLFEAAARLPRSQQQKIGAVLEAFVTQHANR